MVSSRSLSSPKDTWASDRTRATSDSFLMRVSYRDALAKPYNAARPSGGSFHAIRPTDDGRVAAAGARAGERTEFRPADQRRAEHLSNRQGLLQTSRRAHLGIDQRRRHRQG